MSRKKRRRGKKRNIRRIWGIVVLVIILIILLAVLWKMADSKKEGNQIKDATEEVLEFPYSLDDGKIEITSVFQSSVANPDCDDQMGENVASVELKNTSGQFLTSASIRVTLDDDTELHFEVTDIPTDASVWAFETSNVEIAEQPICKVIECDAEYEDDAPLMVDKLSMETEGTTVNVRNLADEDLMGLNVSFHCLFDEDVYFGGKTYTYPIDKIPAGESISLEVKECYLGTAEAVRAVQK